jgi:hypothetical protein
VHSGHVDFLAEVFDTHFEDLLMGWVEDSV